MAHHAHMNLRIMNLKEKNARPVSAGYWTTMKMNLSVNILARCRDLDVLSWGWECRWRPSASELLQWFYTWDDKSIQICHHVLIFARISLNCQTVAERPALQIFSSGFSSENFRRLQSQPSKNPPHSWGEMFLQGSDPACHWLNRSFAGAAGVTVPAVN